MKETMPHIATPRRHGGTPRRQVRFRTGRSAAGDWRMGRMSASYGQFCPIAKASEIFATR
jgi:hypothetical protein